MISRILEIGSYAVPQPFRLAYVQYGAICIAVDVHPGLCGQVLEYFGDAVVH